MTESPHEPGRIDLRAIDHPADDLQAERVISAAMARFEAGRDSDDDVLANIVIYTRPVLAVAAGLVLVATGTLIGTQRQTEPVEPASVLASWAEASHVPTNGELLAVFQGYDR
jgi:hypothetical protein